MYMKYKDMESLKIKVWKKKYNATWTKENLCHRINIKVNLKAKRRRHRDKFHYEENVNS